MANVSDLEADLAKARGLYREHYRRLSNVVADPEIRRLLSAAVDEHGVEETRTLLKERPETFGLAPDSPLLGPKSQEVLSRILDGLKDAEDDLNICLLAETYAKREHDPDAPIRAAFDGGELVLEGGGCEVELDQSTPRRRR